MKSCCSSILLTTITPTTTHSAALLATTASIAVQRVLLPILSSLVTVVGTRSTLLSAFVPCTRYNSLYHNQQSFQKRASATTAFAELKTPPTRFRTARPLTTAMTDAAGGEIDAVQAQIEKASEYLLLFAAEDIQKAIKAVQEEKDPKFMELLEKRSFEVVLDALVLPKSLLHNCLIQSGKRNPSLVFPSSVNNNEDEVRAAVQETVQNVLNKIAPDLFSKLQAGRVMPHFHALFLPETFLGKRLSFDVVTAGEGDEDVNPLELDDFAENLDEAIFVDENGMERAVSSIIDSGGVKSSWRFSSHLTDFAVELVNTDAEMLGEGIECTTLSFIPFELNPCDERPLSLLTRPESRGIVSSIFYGFEAESDVGSVTAITGLPGIGKSWTLFYALQQALLYDGANVLFFFQQSGDAVVYLRRGNKIYAWSSVRMLRAHSFLFKRLDVLVLLDPFVVRRGGAQFFLGDMKLLYAASNHEAYFTNAAAKSNDLQAYLGPPLDKELQVILSFLDPDLKPGVVNERKRNVGNLISYILSNFQYKMRLAATDNAVSSCKYDRTLLREALKDDGMSQEGELINPGTLFHVAPTRPDLLSSIGYDGQGVQYREPAIMASNEDVYNLILSSGRDMILSYWGKVVGDEYVKVGNVAKGISIDDLTKSNGV